MVGSRCESLSDRVILLVEDDRDEQTFIMLALKRNGIPNPVVVANNGAEALDFLFGRGGHTETAPNPIPHLVLMDLQMPKLGGLEVLRQIRAHDLTRLIPVVIMTNSIEERDLVESYRLCANSYVQKPLDFNQFVELIKHLTTYWLTLNTPPPIGGH